MSACLGLDIYAAMPALADLTDVVLTAPADTEVLTYDSGTGKWINAAGGGGVTLPITAAANDVVLQDSGLNPLISLNANELLTLSLFNVGAGSVFASAGDIRWGQEGGIVGLNTDEDTDITVLALGSNEILIGSGGDRLVRILDVAGVGLELDPAFGFTFNAKLAGNAAQGRVMASAESGVGSLKLSATDPTSAENIIELSAPADANAFAPIVGTPDIGTADKPWKDGYFSGFLSTVEMTAPSAPAANGVRVYAQDNGAGKTQLMALFSSGAAQQIAIQP